MAVPAAMPPAPRSGGLRAAWGSDASSSATDGVMRSPARTIIAPARTQAPILRYRARPDVQGSINLPRRKIQMRNEIIPSQDGTG